MNHIKAPEVEGGVEKCLAISQSRQEMGEGKGYY